jgi:hypothetical protein
MMLHEKITAMEMVVLFDVVHGVLITNRIDEIINMDFAIQADVARKQKAIFISLRRNTV